MHVSCSQFSGTSHNDQDEDQGTIFVSGGFQEMHSPALEDNPPIPSHPHPPPKYPLQSKGRVLYAVEVAVVLLACEVPVEVTGATAKDVPSATSTLTQVGHQNTKI